MAMHVKIKKSPTTLQTMAKTWRPEWSFDLRSTARMKQSEAEMQMLYVTR
jgi:hypothetical protein